MDVRRLRRPLLLQFAPERCGHGDRGGVLGDVALLAEDDLLLDPPHPSVDVLPLLLPLSDALLRVPGDLLTEGDAQTASS